MHRNNYNYNYNFSGTSSSVQKPQSTNPYIQRGYEQKCQTNYQSTAHYFIPGQKQVKYYPIGQDQQQYKPIQAASQSSNSFFVNTNKQSRKQFGLKSNDFGQAKSPKSSQNNWFNQASNNISQVSINNTIAQNTNNKLKGNYKNKNTDSTIQNYVNWLYQAFGQFQKSGNINVLKQINQQNQKQSKKLFEQINGQKQNLSGISQNFPQSIKQINIQSPQIGRSPRPKTPFNANRINQLHQQISSIQNQSNSLSLLITKQQNINQQLTYELQQQLQIKQGKNLNQSQIREQNHIKQMQQSITELEQEIKVLQRKNNQFNRAFNNITFFKQWNMMYQQAKGATKLSTKLKHQIQKRQDLIKQLINQDPSNNSDNRSVKRLPSQSGEKPPSNFKKQNKIMDPTINNTITKPQSQLPHKFIQRPDSGRSNDVVIRHLSHSNRFQQSKKNTVSNSVDKTKQRKQSYDQKPNPNSNQSNQWKAMPFPQNLKNFGLNFIGKDVYK